MRNTVIDVIVKNQSVKKFDIIQQSMAIKAIPHMDLVIRDKFSGKSPSKIKTKRQDNDLVIYTDKDDISLIVKDYYTTDDVGILGVQNNGVASYGLNSSQASQLLGGGETVHSLSNTIIADSASKNYSSYLLGLLGLGVTVRALSSNNDDYKPQPKPTTPTQPTNPPVATVKSIETNTQNLSEGGNLELTTKLDNANGNSKLNFDLTGLDNVDYKKISFSNGVTQNTDGTINVPKGVTTFKTTIEIVADSKTEGTENLTVHVGGKTITVTITDTSTAPVTPTPANAVVTEVAANKSVNEGESVTAIVKLDNSNGNAKVAFALSGVETTDYDNATFSNGVTKNADGTLNVPKGVQIFNVTLPIVADKTTEGNQALTVKVGDKTANVTIVDTSITPPPPDAIVTEVTANKSVNEGESVTATVKLDNTNGNAKVAFALTGVETADYGNATFSNGVTKNADGTLNVPKGVQTFTVTLPIIADKATEGIQNLTVKVGDKSTAITIADTSTAPVTPPTPTPTNAVVTEVTANKSVNEGDSLVTTVKLDNTNGNAKVAFALTGANITDKDYNISFNGVTRNNDGTLNVPKGIKEFTITLAITADNTTEGEETVSLNVGGKSADIKIVDSSIEDINGINVNTRIIDANWDLQGGPTAKDRTGDSDHYYVNNNTDKRFVSNTKHHTDNSGLATTEKDDTITVTTTAGKTYRNTAGNIVSANIDLAGGDDKLTAYTQEFSSVHFGEGHDTYTITNINGGQENKFAKVFMETGNDTLTANSITNSHVYMGGGNDTATINQLSGSILDLGTGGFKYTYNSVEYDDHQAFYADGKTALNSDKVDEAGMTNTVNVKTIDGSIIRSGLTDDTIMIEKGTGKNVINLSDGKNNVTIVDGYTSFQTNSNIITGSGNDMVEVGGQGNDFDMNLGEGDNNVKITTKNKSQKGNITTLSGNDVIVIQASESKGNIDAGNGDNQITITVTNNEHKNNIKAGSGKDIIAINNALVENSNIDVGTGNNEITISKEKANLYVLRNSTITALEGDDKLNINGSIDRGSAIDLGAGHNTITITGSSFGDNITTSEGDDKIEVGSDASNNINVGAGDNIINIQGNYGYTGFTSRKTSLIAENGNDTISIGGNAYSDDITLADGKNSLTIGGYNSSNITTGKDKDTITIGGNNSRSAINTGADDDSVSIGGNNTGEIILGDGINTLTIKGYNESKITSGNDQDTIIINGKNAKGAINTGNNNDSITIDGDNTGNITLGEGNNTLIIKGSTESVNIMAGTGDDTINLAENVTGNNTKRALTYSTLNAGDGDNNITLSRATWSSEIITGTGNDTIVINSIAEDNSQIKMGDGNNTLKITGTNSSSVVITAGNGNDIVDIAGYFSAGKNSISLGDGENTIKIGSTSRSSDNTFIRTGKDNDTIIIKGNNEVLIEAGAGDNNIEIGGTNDLSYGTNSITTLEGNDIITIKEGNKATIHAGDGDNTINIGKHNTANITVGSGNDVITLGSSDTKTIDLGEGDNNLTITGKQGYGLTETLSILMGDGNDTINLGSLYNTNIDLKGGTNSLIVNGDTSLYNQTITANSGNDSVHLMGNVTGAHINYTGKDLVIAGNVSSSNITLSNLIDEVTIKGEVAFVNTKLTMRSGDDVLNLGHILSHSDTKGVDGGRGYDILNFTGGGTVSQPKTVELNDFTGFEMVDMTSKDGNSINVLDLYGNYTEYAKSLDGATGLYIRGDDEDAVKMSGYFERFSQTGQTVTDKDNEQYNVWQNTNDPNLLLYIQDNIQIL